VQRTGGSPTFTLLWEYQGRLPVFHWDVYRLNSPYDLEDLGYEDYFYGDSGVNLVEWADRVAELWPEEYLRIDLSYGAGEHERVLTLRGTERYAELLEEFRHADISA
jgi:tRNA threonylcarbamoyladenosine biosynthesis protein TsaE